MLNKIFLLISIQLLASCSSYKDSYEYKRTKASAKKYFKKIVFIGSKDELDAHKNEEIKRENETGEESTSIFRYTNQYSTYEIKKTRWDQTACYNMFVNHYNSLKPKKRSKVYWTKDIKTKQDLYDSWDEMCVQLKKDRFFKAFDQLVKRYNYVGPNIVDEIFEKHYPMVMEDLYLFEAWIALDHNKNVRDIIENIYREGANDYRLSELKRQQAILNSINQKNQNNRQNSRMPTSCLINDLGNYRMINCN